jgi:hypothetical protein
VGEGGKLRLRYTFKPSARQPKDVPFRETFARFMAAEARTQFGPAMLKAMRTRR